MVVVVPFRFTSFRFISFHFAPFRFANYSKPLERRQGKSEIFKSTY